MRKLTAFIFAIVLFFCFPAHAEDWICPSCGASASGNFCSNCGAKYSTDTWICPQCQTTASDNFCYNCGTKKPETNNDLDDQVLDQYKKIGNIVTFGTYPQTSGGKDQTPIEWIVLDYDEANHKVLLLSRCCLDLQPFHNKRTKTQWMNCYLREWLNNDFYNTAFSAEEKKAVLLTEVSNDVEQCYKKWSFKWKNTEDYIFALSYAEVHKYLGAEYKDYNDHTVYEKAYAGATPYAVSKDMWIDGIYTADRLPTVDWWLRSPGGDLCIGNIESEGYFWHDYIDNMNGVRPAFWLDLTRIDLSAKQVAESSTESSEQQDDNTVSGTVKAGDTLFFGRFEQDNNTGNGPEQIEWRVLAAEEGKALVVSVYCLDEMSYWDSQDVMAIERHGINWSTSHIRKWLNGEFYDKAFTEEEKARIPVTTVRTSDRSGSFTTEDRVFVLSGSEVGKYFSGDKDASAPVTEYARSRVDLSRGALPDGVHGIWWLRDMMSVYKEADQYDFLSVEWNEAGYVEPDGGLDNYSKGTGVMIILPGLLTVRPAMWIRTDGTPESADQTEAASNPPEQEDLSGKPEIGIDKAKEIGKTYFDSHFAGKGNILMSGCQTNAAPVDGHDCYNVFYFLENQDMYSIYVDKKSGEIITVIFENGNGQKVLK